MLKRMIAWALALALLASAVPELSLPVTAEGTATPPVEHSHSAEQHDCEHCDATVTWQAWEKTGSLPNTTGHYYLTGDVKLSESVTVTDTANVVLCLNGYTVDGTGTCTPYRVRKTARLTISDCTAYTDQDGVYHAGRIHNGYSGGGVGGAFYVYENAQLTMHAGIVANNRNAQTSEKETDDGYSGGAINIRGSAVVTLKNVEFTGNTTTREGGAIVVRGATAKLIAENCTFDANKAGYKGEAANEASLGGGAIYTKAGTVELKNCTFKNNTTSTNGGAVCAMDEGAKVIAENCTFESNQADKGGAVYTASGTVGLKTCTFKKNESTANGGAICLMESAELTAEKDIFEGNKSGGGSAIYANTGAVNLNACTLKGNKATATGAAALYLVGATAELDSCVFTENEASSAGGSAIYTTTASDLTLKDCTITGNKATGTSTSSRGAVYLTRATDKLTVIGKTVIDGNYVATDGTTVERGIYLQAQASVDVGALTDGAALSIKTHNWDAEDANTIVTAANAPTTWSRQWVAYENNGMAVDYNAAEGFHFALNTDHIHCECGAESCTETGTTHKKVEYVSWDTEGALPASGNYYLSADVKLAEEIGVTGDLNLCLNGHTVTAAENKRIISTPKDTKLSIVITDCTALTTADGVYQAGSLTGGMDVAKGQGGGAIYIRSGGTLKLYDGIITGNTSITGGGALTLGADAQFVMYDGEISGNTALTADGQTWKNGGAIYANAGAKVQLLGGTIKNNTGNNGGGIYTNGADLALKGITISGNNSIKDGAGVYCRAGNVSISGGTLITDNKAAGQGGGVYVYSNTSVTLEGTPVIKANTNTNLYLVDGVTVQVGAMADGASVAVSANIGPISTQCADVSRYFSSDSAYRKVVYQNGALYMVAGGEHEHCLCDGAVSGCDHTNQVWAAWESTTSLPTSGSYYLLHDVVLSDEVSVSKDLNLCLNGHTVTAAKDKRILSSSSGAEVTVAITDCTAATVNGVYAAGKLTGGAEKGNNVGGGAVYMRAGGELKLFEGIITGNTTINGGGAILLAAKSSFTMYGGEISENTAISGETLKNGGGIYALADSQVRLLGGVIKNNKANNGAGIYANGADVKLSGGTVSGNYSVKDGAGVYYRGGNMDISGTVLITGNETETAGGGVCYSGSSTGTISGGIIENNKAGAGGGMIIQGNANVQITGGIIRNNTVTGSGGGIFLYDSALTVTQVTITGNTAKNGGAINAQETAELTIQGGKFTGNTAIAGGGAIYAITNAQADIFGGTISGNTAGTNAGGIYGNGADLKINGGTISKNTSAKDGGGIYFRGGNMDIAGDVLITGNQTKTVGGGVCYSGKATGTISGGTIEKNKASSGGGMIVQGQADVEITGGTIQKHSVTGSGGGVYVYTATLKLTGGTITGNSAKVGAGGIYVNKEGALLAIQGGTISNNSTKNGGGVLAVNKAAVEMKSGKVTGNSTTSSGAGMYISTNSTLKMTGGSVTGNTATGAGGGIYGLQADLTLSGGSIAGNTAKGAGGGGVHANGATVRLYGVSITGNTATGAGGGVNSARRVVKKNGVETSYPSTILLSGSYIANNTAKTGGGIVMSGNGGNMEMHGGTITGNVSTGASGGLYVSAKCTFKMTGGKIFRNESGASGGGVYHNKCTVSYTGGEVYDNRAEMAGGGMYFTSSCTAEFKDFSLYGNTSGTVGGGMYLNNDTPATMTGCKLYENTAGTHGGAIYSAPGAGLTAVNCSFSDNEAVQWGGAIFARDTASLSDCVLTGNKAELGGGFYGGNPGVTYSVNGWGTKGAEVGVDIKNCTFTDNDATLNGGGLYLTMSAFTDMQDTVITGNTSGKEGSGIWAEDDLTMIDVSVTGNVSGNGGYAVYLSDSEYDGQTYIKGLMKMGGDMIIKDNQGGDMFLGNLVTVGALSQGYGAKTHVQITLDKGVLTQRVFGAYNYEGGDQVYTITYGDRSLTEPEYDASLTANTEEKAAQTQPGDILLYAGVGVFVIAIAAVVLLLLKKKKKAADAAAATKE